MKTYRVLQILTALAALTLSQSGKALTFNATTTGNWSLGATWGNAGNNVLGSGVPGASDDAIIPSGITVTYDNGAPATAGTVDVSGSITITKSGGTFGDFNINSGGTFSFGGQVPVTFNGNFTNLGNMNISGQSQTALTTYSGTDKFISGNVTNQVANITGTYISLGTLVVGVNAPGSGHIQGAGSLVNLGTIVNVATAAPTITTLNCSAVGCKFIWVNVNTTPTPQAIAYYDMILGNTGSSAWNLNGVGLTIADDLAITNTGGITSWPANNSIGGILRFFATSGTASTFPATFSIGGLVQTASILTVPANGTLTVTGTGVNAWNRTGGTFNTLSGSTVKFTGAAPVIGGTVSNRFANLFIDSTAANASVTSPLNVTNTLTIAQGGSLDVTALSSSTYSLLLTQSVVNSGVIVGNVDTAVNSRAKLFTGTDGTFGTNSITGNLSLNGTNSINLDVDTTASGARDLLAIGGSLTLNGTNVVLNLKAPSPGAAIDTVNDYTLVTAAGISGTPVLNWLVAPNDAGNYSLVTDSTTIKLHYGGVTPPADSPVLLFSVSGYDLTLSWDTSTYPGYLLQVQSSGSGIATGGWIDVTGIDGSPYFMTIDPANQPAFFRLEKP
jgi:hypothetical protein